MLEVLTYGGIAILLVTAVVDIAKDWKDTSPQFRWASLVFALVAAVVAAASFNLSRKAAADAAAKASAQVEALRAAEETTRSVLSEQNEVLLARVVELEGKVQTEALRVELEETRRQLEETGEKLAPRNAELVIFFESPASPLFKVINTSDHTAEGAQYDLRLVNVDAEEEQFLRIPVKDLDYINGREARGSWAVRTAARDGESIDDGDRVAGYGYGLCKNCPRRKPIAVQYVEGTGGWFAEMSAEEARAFSSARPREYWAVAERIPQARRREIEPQRR